MSPPLFALLLLGNLLLSSCDTLANSPVTLIASPEALQSAIKDHDYLTAVLFGSASCRRCLFLEDVYIKFAQKVRDLVKVYSLDCDELTAVQKQAGHFFICADENKDDLPILTFFEPNPNQNSTNRDQNLPPLEHTYEGSFDLDSLVYIATKRMPIFREEIADNDQLKEFLNDPIPSKVIYLNGNKDTLPVFKALTSEYRDRIKFGQIPKKYDKLTRTFTESELPTLVLLKRDSEGYYQKELYNNNFEFKRLNALLKPLALAEKFQNERQIDVIDITRKTIEKEVNKVEGYAMIHLFSDEPHPEFEEVKSRFKTLFTYFNLNSTGSRTKQYVEEHFKIDTLPSLVVLPIGSKEDLIYEMQFAKFKTTIEIVKEVSDFIGDSTKSVPSDQVQKVITNTLQNKKPIALLFHDSIEISMSYRALSKIPKYRNKIVFSNVKAPQKDIMDAFGIQRLPTLIILFLDPSKGEAEPDFVQLSRFKGKYVYHELEDFIDNTLTYVSTLTNRVNEIRNEEDLKQICSEDSKICVIGLLNGYQGSKEAQQALQEKLNSLGVVSQRHRDINFGWIDAICHVESLMDLEIPVEATPTLIMYNQNSNVFARMEARSFTEEAIESFIAGFRRNGIRLTSIYDPITIKPKNCAEVHKRMSQTVLDDTVGGSKNKKYYTDEL